VREGGYGNDPHSLRNCHIENYFDGIKAITARGGWVIRLGDPTMTPLPKMERVIDYPFTPFKSEFMDLYLIKNCKYYIGQNSGPYDIARLFNKKLIMINSTDLITAVPLARGELIIPKHFYLKAEQRYLSLKEVLAGPNSLIDLWVFDNEKYDLIENRPHEIRDVIVETLDNEGKDIKYSATQIEFLKARKEQIKRVFAENPYMVNASRLPFDLEGWNLNLKFRIASQTSSCEGSIGRTYAAKNWDNDELNLGADAKAPPNFQSL
jgi:putative glycosyltransferase (TIGR04372 family)